MDSRCQLLVVRQSDEPFVGSSLEVHPKGTGDVWASKPRIAIDLDDTDGVGQVVEGGEDGRRRGTFRGTN